MPHWAQLIGLTRVTVFSTFVGTRYQVTHYRGGQVDLLRGSTASKHGSPYIVEFEPRHSDSGLFQLCPGRISRHIHTEVEDGRALLRISVRRLGQPGRK